ncbi:unnamed protein product [Gordionus sp. m RMFG-2023]
MVGQIIGFAPEVRNDVESQGEKDDIYEKVLKAADYINSLLKPNLNPTIGIICGSGLYEIGNVLQNKVEIPYENIPEMAYSKVKGHHNMIVAGKLGDKDVVCFQGRCHFYEGVPLWKTTMSVRIMKMLGVKLLCVTNAAGGINENYKVGDIMVIKDHINFLGIAGNNALVGENDSRYGTRFPSMSNAYDKNIRKSCKNAFDKLKLSHLYHEGVYCCVCGPNYETKSEVRMLKLMKGDAVGMSTAHEVTVARHCDIKVCGLSLITNVIIEGDAEDAEANHEDVLKLAEAILCKKVSSSSMVYVLCTEKMLLINGTKNVLGACPVDDDNALGLRNGLPFKCYRFSIIFYK